MARQTREEWVKRVERWKDSGLTAAEFAAEIGVSVHSLSWWKWRLSAEGKAVDRAHAGGETPSLPEAKATPPTTPRKRSRKKSSSMTFIEVPPPTHSSAIEVILAGGHRVRVPIGFDAPTFERLLSILERGA